MHDTAAQLPKIFQGYEHCLKVSGSVDIHVYIHMNNVDTTKLHDATAGLAKAVAENQPLPPVPTS